ncbi:putative repeat protein (TIGR03943 family) [Amycolatopsis sulphurea]|uniref:Putative repeat protein (TIGR03943 family) n=1 Tax=Amycolatopsis sulphurea TaxID=76022 RepID=A0A2A9FIY8_9PSEU|nr:putative repeat protein (TIGR03943 family) [Amycolatopsis sulphurea]
MRRETQNVLLILLGGALVKIAINGDYLRYVKPAQQPWIIAGGVVMLLLGIVAIVADLLRARSAAKAAAQAGPDVVAAGHQPPEAADGQGCETSDAQARVTAGHHLADSAGAGPIDGHAEESGQRQGIEEYPAGFRQNKDPSLADGPPPWGEPDSAAGHPVGDGHGHHHPARSAWLLVVPVLAVFLVAPPALGADSVTRTEARVPQSAATTAESAFPPLPAEAVVPMAMNEVVSRAGWDSGGTLNGRTIAISGFVVHNGGQTLLARLVISCCAADASPVTVHLKGGEADRFPSDTWLRVTGQIVPGTANEANSYTPDFVPATVERITAPKDPYEY